MFVEWLSGRRLFSLIKRFVSMIRLTLLLLLQVSALFVVIASAVTVMIHPAVSLYS